MWGELHESKTITIELPQKIQAGRASRIFGELGATLHYDVYSFDVESYESWQSGILLGIRLIENNEEKDAQEDFTSMEVVYLFASRPSSDQEQVLNLIQLIINAFDGIARYGDKPFEIEDVQKDWDSCNDFLLKEWGEEPGSKSLAIMIHENYA